MAISNTLIRDFAMHPALPEGANTGRSPRCLRSGQRPEPVMRSPLALIHAHRAERVHRPRQKAHRIKHQAVRDRSTRRAGVPRRILRRRLDSWRDKNRVYTSCTRRGHLGGHAFPGRIADCRGQAGVVAKVAPSTASLAGPLTPLGALQLRLEITTAPG
jgi:hypothetical protein